MMEWLFPRICPICGRVVAPTEIRCEACVRDYPVQSLSLPVLCTPVHDVNCRALYLYQGVVREALLALKFRSQRGRAQGFGHLMSGWIRPEKFDLITYVPMDKARERQRGYNQAMLIAKYCAEKSGVPLGHLIHKIRKTGIQHDLKTARERAENVTGAYKATALHGERVLLCDDIVTTGMTLRSCAQALLDAGASEVQCICVAWANG